MKNSSIKVLNEFHSSIWISKAINQFIVTDLIYSNLVIKNETVNLSSKYFKFDLYQSYFSSLYYNMGITIELFLKSIIIEKYLKPSDSGKNLFSHDLVNLYKKCKIDTLQDELILEILTGYIKEIGRYPTFKKPDLVEELFESENKGLEKFCTILKTKNVKYEDFDETCNQLHLEYNKILKNNNF